MAYRHLARALVLSATLLTGCLVEPSPNAPANAGGAGAAENRNAPTHGASPDVSPASPGSPTSPEVGPFPAASPSLSVSDAPGGKLEAYVRAAAAGLAPEQGEALGRVEGEGPRLLALRGYLRAGRDAGSRWAWSRERIEAYERSPEYAAALAEIEKVRRAFEDANPGYTLRVDTQVRSLEGQLSKWNQTDSVARAGEELLARAREEVGAPSYGEGAAAADVRRFE